MALQGDGFNKLLGETYSIRYLSLGDSFLTQKTNLLMINAMANMIRRQIEIQSVSSYAQLKSTEYLRVVETGDDLTQKKIIFIIRLSKCVSNPENAKETFLKLRSPIVSVNGGSPSPFYKLLTREYSPIVQLEVSSEILRNWEFWNIPYLPKSIGKYDIPMFLCLYYRMDQKKIIIDITTLKKELGNPAYLHFCDLEKRCLKPAQKHISKAFDDGLSALKFEYEPIKHGYDKTDVELSFTLIKSEMNNVGKKEPVKRKYKNTIQEEGVSKSDCNNFLDIRSVIDSIHDYVLNVIMSQSWKSFESFVCSLMLKMDYGDYHPYKAYVTSSTRDNGIDGYLELDDYGQKKIYFQAKRWDNTKVGRPELQKFVGALHSYNNAIAGFFVTTSTFTNDALTYADSLSCSFDIILIDKNKLCKLIGKYLL